jgi:lysophospholipase L1-like esterase
MKKAMIGTVAIVATVAAGAFGAVAGAHHVRVSMPRSHIESRGTAILSQAAQARFDTVVLGDSIVELADLPEMCGRRALNAGLAGARVAQVEALAARLLPRTRPSLVVLAVGVNDANVEAPTDPAAFARDYRAILAQARAAGARVVAVNIEPVASARFPKTALFDRARIDAENRQIAEMGVPVLDLRAAMAPGAGDTLPDRFTDDGVHPNATGYATWKRTVADACAATA